MYASVCVCVCACAQADQLTEEQIAGVYTLSAYFVEVLVYTASLMTHCNF